LDAAGANCANIHALTGWREQEGETVTTGSVTLADLPVIKAAMAQYSPALVIIDPLQAYTISLELECINGFHQIGITGQ
jgi:hypothetical protein